MANKLSTVLATLPFYSSVAATTKTFASTFDTVASGTFFWGKPRSAATPSAFRYFVSNIIFIRSQKKMTRIYANWVVASMQNMKTVWNSIKVKFVAIPMYGYGLVVDAKLPIRLGLSAKGFSLPNPATFSLSNFFPESIFRSSKIGIAMTSISVIMGEAIAKASYFFSAIFNDTYFVHKRIVAQHLGVI